MPMRVYPESAIETALRLYQECKDRLRNAEARIEGNVMSGFRLNANVRGQAIALLLAQADVNLAREGLAAAVAEENNDAETNGSETEERPAAPGPALPA